MLRMLSVFCVLTILSTTVRGQDSPAPGAEPSDSGQASSGESAPSPPDPASAAAKAAFDNLQQQWMQIVQGIAQTRKDRAEADPAERAASDAQMAQLRTEADGLVPKIVDAGLEVFRASPDGYPEVNSTLLAIVQFYMVGDHQGDGGDQYEKALPTLQALLEAGAGERWPHLWTWGAVAAYCVNEFDLASAYFEQAQAAGALGDAPPSRNPQDPRNKVWQSAKQYAQTLPTLRRSWEKEKKAREAEAQADDLPRVKLTTSKGEVVLELFENEAPQAVASFLSLVKKGFYDGVVFHRVLPGFMAQGGDPTGTGSGGPGYSIRCECYSPDTREHFRGSLSMAHAGRDTGGSQFFLTFVPTTFLNGRHTVFGRVVEGMENAAAIKRRDPQSPSAPEPDKILKAEVLRDRGHAYEFARLPER